MNQKRENRRAERGSNIIEYSVLLALVSITVIASLQFTGAAINNKFIDVANIIRGGNGYCNPIAMVPIQRPIMVASIVSDTGAGWVYFEEGFTQTEPTNTELDSSYGALQPPPALSPQAAGCL